MTVEKKQLEMDEFCAGLTPPVEKGLTRMEYHGDGIIPLLVDVEYVEGESPTDVSPGCEESANIVAVWHAGTDIVTILSEGLIEEMEINFLESDYGGDADEGEDDGQSRLDRLLEEEFERNAP